LDLWKEFPDRISRHENGWGSGQEGDIYPQPDRMNTTSEMTDATKKTLTIRVPVVVRHEEEMDYDRFCEEYMSAEDDEDSPTLEKRCRETWEALLELYERDGYVELEEIDAGECDEGDVLNEYTDAGECFQGVVDDALDDLKRRREYEATREQREAAGKAAKQKMLEERKQKAKEAEEFAAWKKAREEEAAKKAAAEAEEEARKAQAKKAEEAALFSLMMDAEADDRHYEEEEGLEPFTFKSDLMKALEELKWRRDLPG